MLNIQILVDNSNSWIVPYAKELVGQLEKSGCCATLKHSAEEITKGDILCLLACERIFNDLHLNKKNLVVHESALPKGKGWSPVSWQVLAGSKRIPVTLFEASKKIDSGVIYDQRDIVLLGDELWPEIKRKQGTITIQLILDFVKNYPNNNGVPQRGEESFYKKRNLESSELDITKSIEDQFNLLRICDNERYPAFFILNGVKYYLKIDKQL